MREQEEAVKRRGRTFPASWLPYGGVFAAVAALSVVLHRFELAFDLVNIALMYLIPVLVSAVYWGIGPSIAAAASGVLAFDFFFVPPYWSFTVADLRYVVSFLIYLAVAALTSTLAARLRRQRDFARQREATTATLYAISRQMTAMTDLRGLLESMARQAADTTDMQVDIYVPDDTDDLQAVASWPLTGNSGATEPEAVIAKWVYRHGERAGRGTQTLGQSRGLYLPLQTEAQVYGVLAVRCGGQEPSNGVEPETMRLLEAIGGLAASAIARVKLGEEAKLAHLTAESERIRTALLDSVSHELRTPLAAIIGSATGLIDNDRLFSADDRLELLGAIKEGALRMNRLVTNLLGMVQLESGMLRLRKKWCDISDMLGVVLAQVKELQQQRRIVVALPELPLYLPGDEVLLEQVLVNVVSNAIKYSPDGSTIEITVTKEEHAVSIAVKDTGIGISEADLERVFDKFYRSVATKRIPGTGLGLAICKGIVEAHGGLITAASNAGQGATMTITLPTVASDVPETPSETEETT
ncbi:DUF4118 domain-containing protein [Paenibacillus athensensis]|uniref:histidine kinase n=1 Tax=Paenibacillus athensensis TaxID=1967502 RepID=A0A4Y8PYM3_9BACL|nr:ATP-binding protein [Paenibacillus athensensis]MCD1261241.1 DUF4118 domain-containing protein [Paenibacillus athensensis]